MAPFSPKTDLNEYIDNALNYEIYCALTDSIPWENLFEPLSFFNLLYQQFDWILNNVSKPLNLQSELVALKLEPKAYYFLLDCLLKLVLNEADPVRANIYITSRIFRDSYELLDVSAKLSVRDEFRRLGLDIFQQRKKNLLLIFTLIEKEQYRIDKEFNLDLPIPYTSEIEQEEETPILKLNTSKRGSKADVIRIFNAMFDLLLLETVDGSTLTKEKFMMLLGRFIGEDFEDVSNTLSQALKASSEKHLDIFEQLKKKGELQWKEINEKGKKSKNS